MKDRRLLGYRVSPGFLGACISDVGRLGKVRW